MKLIGNLVDIHNRKIFPAALTVKGERIDCIEKINNASTGYILPGLIDSHIHIESSMITPGAFAMQAVRHGTTAVVSDPHEIANVLGIEGVKFMLDDAKKVPLKFWFGAPSCVPATSFETSGGRIGSAEVEELMMFPEIRYLSEMMNFPGVVHDDPEVLRKLQIAGKLGKPVDGHAPGLGGEMLRKYVSAGISTDHECSTIEEAREKIALGMKILMREGSAARNLAALKDLLRTNPGSVMLCSDDLHPEMLLRRHINKLIALLISEGYDLFDVIRSATLNPAVHYNLDAGLLREADKADLIIVDDPALMNVQETWIEGKKVFSEGGMVHFSYEPGKAVNKFRCSLLSEQDIAVSSSSGNIRVMEAFDGELFTKSHIRTVPRGIVLPAITDDILKIVVKDRYDDSPPAVGFVSGFRLQHGAFASSVAHDSHNIIAIGTNDSDIISSVNEIVRMKGGLSCCSNGLMQSLQLNVAGIMTTKSCREVAGDYEEISNKVRSYGCTMSAPFMTLSFMALLVIPALKIGDRGLFDVNKFSLVPLDSTD